MNRVPQFCRAHRKQGRYKRTPAELPKAARNALHDGRGHSQTVLSRARDTPCAGLQEQRDKALVKCSNLIKPNPNVSVLAGAPHAQGTALTTSPCCWASGWQPRSSHKGSAAHAAQHICSAQAPSTKTSRHTAWNKDTDFIPKNCQERRKGNYCSVTSEGLLTGKPPRLQKPAPN